MIMKGSNRNATLLICFPPETLIKRQATQHDCQSILLGAGGTKEVGKCTMRKPIFCTGPTRAAKAGQKISCTGTASPVNQPRGDSFHLYSLSPHLPQFQRSIGATPLWCLWLPLSQFYLIRQMARLPMFADKHSKAKTT